MSETNVNPVKTSKKLIEVALPLDAINAACAHEKMPGIGPHPRGLHLWWARRPLAAASAVIFAQMVNDPGWKFDMDGTKPTPQQELFS
jgi:putative DNA methylase